MSERINDRHGHRVGDLVLASVADRLAHASGLRADVARLGGDEFAVVERRATDVKRSAQEVRAAVAQPIVVEGLRVMLSASVGAAVSSVHGGGADSLIDIADGRLYEAKRSGRNRVVTGDDDAGAGSRRPTLRTRRWRVRVHPRVAR